MIIVNVFYFGVVCEVCKVVYEKILFESGIIVDGLVD